MIGGEIKRVADYNKLSSVKLHWQWLYTSTDIFGITFVSF